MGRYFSLLSFLFLLRAHTHTHTPSIFPSPSPLQSSLLHSLTLTIILSPFPPIPTQPLRTAASTTAAIAATASKDMQESGEKEKLGLIPSVPRGSASQRQNLDLPRQRRWPLQPRSPPPRAGFPALAGPGFGGTSRDASYFRRGESGTRL